MSGIAAVASLASRQPASGSSLAALDALLAAQRNRGADSRDHWSDAAPRHSVALGVVRHDWELPSGEPQGLVHRGQVVIAADATLYHRHDLRRLLAQHGVDCGVAAGSAELIVAAYEAFGESCVDHLEGDFAFVIWDGAHRRLFAARDFTGRRTLFHARAGDSLLLASSIGALLAVPAVSRELSLATVATVAAGLWLHSHETAYRGISELPAGHRFEVNDGTTRIERYWHPPATMLTRRESVADASRQLRELLVDAVDQRMSASGPTAVSLSGGWDSPAVFGAGQLAMDRSAFSARSLRAVSISYPVGDPGREDEIIRDILARWNASADWIDVDCVPVFNELPDARTGREEPFAHPYEEWNRELSRGARRAGARVILDGAGGDQLFQTSGIFLADLLREGRWMELARQWRATEGRGARSFYRAVMRPALPPGLNGLIARARGMTPPPHHLERQPPFWFRRRFLDEHGVLERERLERPSLAASNLVMEETHAFLLFPYFTRIMRLLSGYALEEGVELRAPLMDARVVRFAAERPWHERANGRETKLVLRGAMRGVLPDNVLAPREKRTGTTSAYFLRQLRAAGRPHFESMLTDSRLADVGMIDPGRLRRAWEHLIAHGDDELGVRLYFTLQAERWLRARAA